MGPLTLCRLTGGSIGLSVLHTVDELLEADLGGVFWISAPGCILTNTVSLGNVSACIRW